MGETIHTAEFDSVYIKATDVAHVAADKVAGVKDFSRDSSRTMTELVFHGDDLAVSKPGHRTLAFSLSGSVIKGDNVQKAMRDAHNNGTVVYLTVIDDEAAPAGSQGERYAVYVESYNEKRPQGDVIGFDAAFALASKTITAV